MTWRDDFGPLSDNPLSAMSPAEAVRAVDYKGPHLLFTCALCLGAAAVTTLTDHFGSSSRGISEAVAFLSAMQFGRGVAPEVAVREALSQLPK